MCKLFAFFMLSSVAGAAYAMEDTKEIQKVYPRWVQNAAVIYVYNKKGVLQMSVPITHGATMSDVRRYLIDEYIMNENSRYSLAPLYNEWWRFGHWNYADQELLLGKVKDHMERYNTQSFWLNPKPRKMRDASDSE